MPQRATFAALLFHARRERRATQPRLDSRRHTLPPLPDRNDARAKSKRCNRRWRRSAPDRQTRRGIAPKPFPDENFWLRREVVRQLPRAAPRRTSAEQHRETATPRVSQSASRVNLPTKGTTRLARWTSRSPDDYCPRRKSVAQAQAEFRRPKIRRRVRAKHLAAGAEPSQTTSKGE